MILAVYIILTYCASLMSTTKRTERKDEQLALNPVELLDLIIEEQMRMDMAALKRHKTNPKFDKHLLDTEEMEITTIKNQDEDTLKKRKIWSRWTKWSDCSVTCGDGTISRLRLCVSGRCAPGEHEEQRRLCNRAPCAMASDTTPDMADELHDFE